MTWAYLRWRGPRFVTVCDRGGVKFVKSSVYNCTKSYVMDNLWFQKITITQIQYSNVQQIIIVVVTFEFTGAARGFMIMSCAARGVKKVGQHCSKSWIEMHNGHLTVEYTPSGSLVALNRILECYYYYVK